VFAFKEHDLQLVVSTSDPSQRFVDDLIEGLTRVRFEPVIFNASAGLVFTF
jgi:hypothetical protein